MDLLKFPGWTNCRNAVSTYNSLATNYRNSTSTYNYIKGKCTIMDKVLVVLSGGQDSTTCLFIAKELGRRELHTITFDYGQRHRREIESAGIVSRRAGAVSHEIIDVRDALKSTSPLVDKTAALEQYHSHAEMEKIIGDRVELTFVPMRNALFLTIAANRAVALGADQIYIGVCEEDNANYPDCRDAFVSAQSTAIRTALGSAYYISLCAPLLHISKPDSIRAALTMSGCYHALAYTHTAYDGTYPPSGKDHATVLRAHAFATVGLPDPLIARAWLEGVLPYLPSAPNYEYHNDALRAASATAQTAGVDMALARLEAYCTLFLARAKEAKAAS